MKVLRSRLLDLEMQKQRRRSRATAQPAAPASGRRRSAPTTSPEPVTDHRVNVTIHRLPAILEGDLDPLIEPISAHFQAEQLKEEVRV